MHKILAWLALFTGVALAQPLPLLHGDLDIPNLDLVKTSVREYHKSGRYLKDVDAIAGRAQAYLTENLPRYQGQRPAIVLDIDETTLSNYSHLQEFDFAYVPRFWNAWVHRAQAPALKGPLEFYRYAQEHHVAVLFITGRSERDRVATERNLKRAGFGGWQALVMRSQATDIDTGLFKCKQRRRFTLEGYTIVVNLGDQASDLEGGYAEAAFKLPNPMYYVP